MDATEVVQRTNQIHPSFNGGYSSRQHAGSSSEDRQATAEGAIQPFDERGVQHLTAGRRPQQRQEHPHAPVDESMDRAAYRPPGILLDDLRNHQILPANQARSSTGAGLAGSKGTAHDIDIGLEPVSHEQQRAEAGTSRYHSHQALNQAAVTTGADRATQPQARRHHQRECHPQHTGLCFEPDLIRLYVHQIARLDNLIAMKAFTMLPRCLDPFPHGLGLQAKCGFDCRDWTAMPDQRDHLRDNHLVATPTEEGSASAGAKRLVAHLTFEARPGLAMAANVALADLPSCRTVHVRAKYVWRTHRLLLVFGDTQDIVGTFANFSSAGGQTTV
jgi:hypothetical protein